MGDKAVALDVHNRGAVPGGQTIYFKQLAPKVIHTAPVSQITFLSPPVYMQAQVVSDAGQITKTFIYTEHLHNVCVWGGVSSNQLKALRTKIEASQRRSNSSSRGNIEIGPELSTYRFRPPDCNINPTLNFQPARQFWICQSPHTQFSKFLSPCVLTSSVSLEDTD